MVEKHKFWVGIHRPTEIRKGLLSSSKECLDCLRRYETFRNLRREKLEAIVGLKRMVDDLVMLNRKLRNSLPKVPKHKAVLKAEERKSDKHMGSKKKRGKTKMDMLEDELAKIEQRLETIE